MTQNTSNFLLKWVLFMYLTNFMQDFACFLYKNVYLRTEF